VCFDFEIEAHAAMGAIISAAPMAIIRRCCNHLQWSHPGDLIGGHRLREDEHSHHQAVD
jgi:hypothetical protein